MPRGILIVVLMLCLAVVAACGGKGADSTAVPPPAPTTAPAEPEVPVTAESTTPAAAEVTPGGTLSLTLAAGDVRVVPVVQCLGMRPGEFLDMRATNTLDLAAPGRVDVQVSGIHHGPGQPANLFVSVIVGGPTSPVFMGNVPAAPVEILAEGAGRFSGVPIVNAAVGSPVFVYGQEYPITAEWRCAP